VEKLLPPPAAQPGIKTSGVAGPGVGPGGRAI